VAEDISDKIVARLEAEGQLTRNTGTNSIKSLRTDFGKFESVFSAINENIINQTEILSKTLALQLRLADVDNRKSQIEEAERLAVANRPSTNVEREQDTRPSKTISADNGFGLGNLFGVAGVGGFGGAAAAGLLGMLKAPLKAALLTTLAPTVGKILGDLTEKGLLQLGADGATATNFGEAANFAGIGGMIGLAFGRRMGLVGAAAGAAASFGDDVLDALGLDKDKMVTIFGKEMRMETAAQGVMGALGASVTAVATSPGFRKSITSFMRDSVDINGNPLSRFPRRRALLGATIGAAVLGAYITYGDELKSWIDDQDFPKPVAGVAKAGVDVVSMTTSGAAFGMMFGPQGALVGAAIGFALGIGKVLFDWLKDKKDKAAVEFKKDVEKLAPAIEAAKAGTATEEQAQEIRRVTMEAERRTNLFLPQAQIDAAKKVVAENNAALGNMPLDADQGITANQNQDRVFKALSGDAESFKDLQRYIYNTGATDPEDGAEAMIYFGRKAIRDRASKVKGLPTKAMLEENQKNMDLWEDMVGAAQFAEGTRGFQDFGKGSFAVLHGREAVVPETTPGGQFLKSYFDESFQPIMSGINQVAGAAMNQVAGAVTYAPVTLAPITNNSVQGGSTRTVINSLGKNTSDLDVFSRPGGVH